MNDANHLPAGYFASIYAKDPDPWGFESRWYEKRKYALTVAALPRERYLRAFEPGCANGALTHALAARCGSLLATDLVPEVVTRARARLSACPHVEIRTLAIPEGWPDGTFDLIVLSEVVYYLTRDGIADLLVRLDGALAPGGHVVAVHWTGETDYPISGRDVHAVLDAHPAWSRLVFHEDPQFLLAVYEWRSP